MLRGGKHPVVGGCRMCQDTESPVWRLTGLLSPDDHKINGALGRVERDWMIELTCGRSAMWINHGSSFNDSRMSVAVCFFYFATIVAF